MTVQSSMPESANAIPGTPPPPTPEGLIPGEKLLDHDADGIREYDNPLPSWWMLIFVITIVFSVGYIFYYHLGGPGLSIHEELALEMKAAAAAKATVAATSEPTDDELRTLANDTAAMTKAKAEFDGKCAACHRTDGGGLIGPNLTDDHWIHGGKPVDIFRVVRDGVPAKGMIAWGAMLSPADLRAVSAYILKLHGTNPANPKAPEGMPVTP